MRFSLSDSTLYPSYASSSEKYLKKLVGRTDIEDALTKMNNMIQGEHGMATAQLLKATSDIKDGGQCCQLGLYLSLNIDYLGVKELVQAKERKVQKAGEDKCLSFSASITSVVETKPSPQGIRYERTLENGSLTSLQTPR